MGSFFFAFIRHWSRQVSSHDEAATTRRRSPAKANPLADIVHELKANEHRGFSKKLSPSKADASLLILMEKGGGKCTAVAKGRKMQL